MLDVGEWNIEWFGSVTDGPRNEALQLRNVREVILHADLDIWGLEEIVDSGHFHQLLDGLPGYAGVLANDPMVAGGSDYYMPDEQKVGVLYQRDTATLQRARIILGEHEADFAGRPPLLLHMKIRAPVGSSDLVFIVLHAKAMTDWHSYRQRSRAAAQLKAYLDREHPRDKVLVVGDFNDDVDTSITPGKPSPYAVFVNDPARYRFVTAGLSAAGETSTTYYPEVVDHHLATNELAAAYIEGSAQIIRADKHIPRFFRTTSDHYPTVSRYCLKDG